ASGFSSDEKARCAGVGAELNAWDWTQLRAGYRANMRNSDHNMFTAGIGISPFNVVHLDLTGMAGTHRSYGAAAQLVFTF
ncbi:MAG: conjugal transfer protein TraF, partial [Serratia symbiotica]|nr:conjugal transfer protein TraF [Serratia symbiotica]